jgi:hypothetical protein
MIGNEHLASSEIAPIAQAAPAPAEPLAPSAPAGPPAILDLPALATADVRLPAIYQSAKATLAECVAIDECQEWANKAEALASYAKQAQDDELRRMADRIQARAVLRCGELLQQIPPDPGGRPSKTQDGAVPSLTRTQAADNAGLSERQRKTALRVASIPPKEFEKTIESANPPTVTQLAERGIHQRQLTTEIVSGRSTKDKSTNVQEKHTQRRRIDGAIYKEVRVALENLRGMYPPAYVVEIISKKNSAMQGLIDHNIDGALTWLKEFHSLWKGRGREDAP